jgi:hypothetical protein
MAKESFASLFPLRSFHFIVKGKKGSWFEGVGVIVETRGFPRTRVKIFHKIPGTVYTFPITPLDPVSFPEDGYTTTGFLTHIRDSETNWLNKVYLVGPLGQGYCGSEPIPDPTKVTFPSGQCIPTRVIANREVCHV